MVKEQGKERYKRENEREIKVRKTKKQMRALDREKGKCVYMCD